MPHSPALAQSLRLALAALPALSGCAMDPAVRPEPSRSASGTLIVLNRTDDSVSLIDAMTGDRLAELSTGAGPLDVAVSPDGALAVISNAGRADAPGHTLTVIDLALSEVAGTIELDEHARPHGVQFLADGRTLVVTSESSGSLLLVDVPGRRVLRAVATAQADSHRFVLEPGGRRAYVANIGAGSVSVIDLERAKVVAEIATAPDAEGIDLSPDGSQLWVANRDADTVSIVDTGRLIQVATLACPGGPIRVKFTPDGARALVSNTGSGDVAVFDVGARTELGRIPLGFSALEATDSRLFGADGRAEAPMPVGLLVSHDGERAWVSNSNADLVTVLDLDSLAIAGRIKTGHEPDGLGWTSITPLGM